MQKRLIIRPKCAKLTRDTELIGKMSPYVIANIGANQQVSGVHKSGGKYPSWQDTLPFDINPNFDRIIEIVVMDQDKFKSDDLVGDVQIPVDTIPEEGILLDWYNIQYKGKKSGQVRLELGFDNNATFEQQPVHADMRSRTHTVPGQQPNQMISQDNLQERSNSWHQSLPPQPGMPPMVHQGSMPQQPTAQYQSTYVPPPQQAPPGYAPSYGQQVNRAMIMNPANMAQVLPGMHYPPQQGYVPGAQPPPGYQYPPQGPQPGYAYPPQQPQYVQHSNSWEAQQPQPGYQVPPPQYPQSPQFPPQVAKNQEETPTAPPPPQFAQQSQFPQQYSKNYEETPTAPPMMPRSEEDN